MSDLAQQLRSIVDEARRLDDSEADGVQFAPCLDDGDSAIISLAADRLTLYETALRTIQEALPKYAREDPTMTAAEFALVVLGAVDNPEVFRALNGTSGPPNAIVGEGMEEWK
jgi:transposase